MNPGRRPSLAQKNRNSRDRTAQLVVDRTPSPTILGLSILIIASVVLFLAVRPISDSDFWHHIAFGRVLVEQGRFPVTDELSSTAASRPWVSSGWLPSVALYTAYRASPALPIWVVVFPVALLASLLIFYWGCRRTGNAAFSCFLTLLAIAASYPRFLPRPDIVSQLLIVPLIMLLTWYEEVPLTSTRKGLLRAALLPLLFLVWANCHMLFVIGLAIAGIFILWALLRYKEGRRSDGPILIASFAAACLTTLATPYGYRAYWFIWENAQLHNVSARINELKPSWLLIGTEGGGGIAALILLWLVPTVWLVLHGRKADRPWWQFAVAAFLVGLALIQRRQISIAAFGVTPLALAAAVDFPPVRFFARRYAVVLPAIFAALLMVARMTGFLAIPSGLPRSGVDCQWFPCEAVGFLKGNPPPPVLFHDLYTGGYLAYHLAPDTKVFIDGRLEVYNNGTFDDFFAPPEGRMPIMALFQKYHVESALLDWRAAAVQPSSTAAILASRPDWRLCWFSDHYALFVHADDTTTAYTDAHAYRYLNPLYPQAFTDALSDATAAPVAQAEARRALSQNPGSHLSRTAASIAGVN